MNDGVTLLDVLEAYRDSSVQQDEETGGQVLVGTSAKGHSLTFSDRAQENPSVSRVEFGQMLVDAFAVSKAALGGTPTDQQVFDDMMAKLRVVRRIRADFTNLIR